MKCNKCKQIKYHFAHHSVMKGKYIHISTDEKCNKLKLHCIDCCKIVDKDMGD